MALACRKTRKQALRLYFRAGNAGIADAFAAGGELYLEENPPDYREAKSWLEQAVQGGSADGYADLGWMYESGNGVSRDPAKALGLFNEAAKRGSGEGMYRIGYGLLRWPRRAERSGRSLPVVYSRGCV